MTSGLSCAYSCETEVEGRTTGTSRQARDSRDPDGDDMLERVSGSGQRTSRRRWETRRTRLVSASPATVGSGFHRRSYRRFRPRRPALDGSARGAEVPADNAPPRSWEQFEELCADVFQSAWSDPGLVRHGRGGQTQNGVDIVARHGAIYPIGLQCNKRRMWSPRRLAAADVDEAVAMAESFELPLKQFYILTTAPNDAGLLKHVYQISRRHKSDGRFTIGLFGWDEIVRRAMLDPAVTAKHFGPSADAAARSPLLATWFMSEGCSTWSRRGAGQPWSLRDAGGLATEEDFEAGQRLDAEVGYGLGLRRGPGVVTPFAGVSLAEDEQRTLRAGTRWVLGDDASLELEGARTMGEAGQGRHGCDGTRTIPLLTRRDAGTTVRAAPLARSRSLWGHAARRGCRCSANSPCTTSCAGCMANAPRAPGPRSSAPCLRWRPSVSRPPGPERIPAVCRHELPVRRGEPLEFELIRIRIDCGYSRASISGHLVGEELRYFSVG